MSGKSFRRRFLTESKAIAAPVWMQMRQQGKSAALAAMYGTGRMQRTHPFDFVSGYTYVSHDTRFGSVPVYKVTTKTTSEIMRRERVPHTDVYYRPADELMSVLDSNVVVIAWVRRTNLHDLQTAVATLLMLGKEPVIVRAFEP